MTIWVPRESRRFEGERPFSRTVSVQSASLISDIEHEVIALPDLQRPFVWEDTKVRDLLDSLFVGFPVGTLVFWHTSDEKDARALGEKRPGLRATTLVIDGQQRLTSLYAVMKGGQVVGKDGDVPRPPSPFDRATVGSKSRTLPFGKILSSYQT